MSRDALTTLVVASQLRMVIGGRATSTIRKQKKMGEKEKFDIEVPDVDYHNQEYDELAYFKEKYWDLKQQIINHESTISLLRSDNERLREKCDKQAMFFRQYFPEKYPDTPFISAVIGERDQNGVSKYLWVAPAFGVDFSYVYEYNGNTVGGMGS